MSGLSKCAHYASVILDATQSPGFGEAQTGKVLLRPRDFKPFSMTEHWLDK